MEKTNLQLSLFRGVKDTQPWPVTLDELVAMMRSDQSVRDLTEKHRYALSVGDKQSARRYKDMMLSFGIAAHFEGGRLAYVQCRVGNLRGWNVVPLTGNDIHDNHCLNAHRSRPDSEE